MDTEDLLMKRPAAKEEPPLGALRRFAVAMDNAARRRVEEHNRLCHGSPLDEAAIEGIVRRILAEEKSREGYHGS